LLSTPEDHLAPLISPSLSPAVSYAVSPAPVSNLYSATKLLEDPESRISETSDAPTKAAISAISTSVRTISAVLFSNICLVFV